MSILPPASTRLSLSDIWINLIRMVWLALAGLCLGLFVWAIAPAYDRYILQLSLAPLAQMGISPASYSFYLIGWYTLVAVVFALVAAVVFWAKPNDWMAILVSVAFLTFGVTTFGVLDVLTILRAELGMLVALLQSVGWGAILVVLYLFPDGRFVPRWSRWLLVAWGVWALAFYFAPPVVPDPSQWNPWVRFLINFFTWNSEQSLPRLYTYLRQFGFVMMMMVWLTTGMLAQMHRYWHVSTPVQRHQTKWAMLGIVCPMAGSLIFFLPHFIFPAVNDGAGAIIFNMIATPILAIGLSLWPLSIGVSLLRFRLWDVDVIINRTLVYGALTTLLGGLYFGSVLLFQGLSQGLFSHITQQQSNLILVASTLAIAALFRPLRARLQDFIDRRFYREKVDFRRALTDFSREVRTVIDLPELERVLIQRMTALLHIQYGAVFLQQADGKYVLAQAHELPSDCVFIDTPCGQPVEGLPPPTVVQLPLVPHGLQRLQSGAVIYKPEAKSFPLMLPLIAPHAGGQANELVGVLALGPRLSGLPYSREDQALLLSLADQAGTSIRVAQLVAEKQAEAERREEAEERLAAHRNSPLGRAESFAESILKHPENGLIEIYRLTQIAGHDPNAALLIGNLPKVFDNLGAGTFARLAEGFNYMFNSRVTPEMLSVGLRAVIAQLESAPAWLGAEESLPLTQTCQTALEAGSISQITAWTLPDLGGKTPQALPDLYRFLVELQGVAHALRAYERVDTPADKLTYLARAVERLGRVERSARMELGSADRPVIQRIAENWLALVTGVMSELQIRAQIVCDLLTRHTWQDDVIAVALNVRNEGRGAALNIKISLAPSAEYTLLDDRAEVERLAPGEETQVQLRVRPRLEAGADRFRARFVVLYTDPRGPDQVENFADVVHLMAATTVYRFIPNPYVVGTPLQPGSPLFFGREDVVTFVQGNLAAAHRNNLVLIGQRRTGKSSLLKQLPLRLGEDYVPVYLDGQSLGLDPGLPNFFLALATEIAFALEDRGQGITPPEMSDFADSPATAFERQFLPRVRQAIGTRHLLLLLDEFEELEAAVRRGNLDASVFAFLRHLIQHTENLSVIFCGTHRLEELAADYWNVLFNISLYRHIGFLEQDEAVRLIQEPVAAYGMRYDDLALDKIWRVTAGHPYFLQLLCHSLVNRHNKTQRPYVTVADVNAALDEILASGEAHFVFLWTESTSAERLALMALSRMTALTGQITPVQIVDYLAERGVTVARQDIGEALRHLALRDILRASDSAEPGLSDAYRWKLGLLGLWAEKYQSFSHVASEAQALAH